MRAAKTVEIGFVKTVARGIRTGTLPGGGRSDPRFSGFLQFDKRRGCMHPQTAMTTALTRAAALSGLILIVVAFILP
jgi:hypothetical protein